MKAPATLVFDIGKTTKKALVFDREYHVAEEETQVFPEMEDEDGFPCEDLPAVAAWVRQMALKYLRDGRYDVQRLNFSAYGASLAAIGAGGELITPFYNYLKPFPEAMKERFFAAYNTDNAISETTASPWLGMLNSGLQAYWTRYANPARFEKTRTLLHLPQYFPFLFSGQTFCEETSIGCHTMLWDFRGHRYHPWAIREGIAALFPPTSPATRVFPTSVGGKEVIMGIGVHDSSAALMPYLVSLDRPFLLLSTGTWNICFNPFNADPLSQPELQRDGLCYLTYQGKPVKASRIFLGHEHEAQQRYLAAWFGVDDDAYKKVSFNPALYDSLPAEHGFVPLSMEGTGPLPQKQERKTDLSAFATFEVAQHQLARALCQWQKLSVDLVDPEGKTETIIMVGGFSKSPLFIEALKRELTGRKIYLSDHPRASALGAAWLVNDPSSYNRASALLEITIA